MPATTRGYPYPSSTDDVDVPDDLRLGLLAVDADVAAIEGSMATGFAQTAPPVGAMAPYAGAGDPAGGKWLLADGRLVNKTTYAALFAAIGHSYNAGVDPGGNMVRLPDKRGRATVGADDMGTAQGAAGRLPNSNRARGQNGGAERHTLSTAEIPSHTHPFAHSYYGNASQTLSAGASSYLLPLPADGPDTATQATGGGGAHNNMQPYEVDNWIVRVA